MMKVTGTGTTTTLRTATMNGGILKIGMMMKKKGFYGRLCEVRGPVRRRARRGHRGGCYLIGDGSVGHWRFIGMLRRRARRSRRPLCREEGQRKSGLSSSLVGDDGAPGPRPGVSPRESQQLFSRCRSRAGQKKADVPITPDVTFGGGGLTVFPSPPHPRFSSGKAGIVRLAQSESARAACRPIR